MKDLLKLERELKNSAEESEELKRKACE